LSETPAKPLWVRAARVAGFAAAGLALGALLLLAGGYALLQTPASSRSAREVVLQAKDQLAGRLTLGEVRISGALELCIDGVDLRDPDGNPAFSARSLCLSLEAALLRNKLAHLRFITLEAPVVDLADVPGEVPGTTTTTLQRALAPKTPSQPKKESRPFDWVITLDRLDLREGRVLLRDGPGKAPHLDLEQLSLENGSARYSATGAAGKLSLSGRLSVPGGLPAQLSLDAALEGAPGKGTLTLTALDASLGGAGLRVAGALALPALTGKLHLSGLRATPHDVAALQGLADEKGPLLEPVSGAGEVTLSGGGGEPRQAKLELHLEATGKVDLTATATLGQPLRFAGQLALHELDPGAIARGAPRGKISARLDVEGRGIPKYKDGVLSGELEGALAVGPAHVEGLGRLSASVGLELRGETLRLTRLEAAALALQLKGKGTLSPKALGLELEAAASDLSVFARALAALEHKPPLQLTGSGRLKASVTGTPKDPQAQLHLTAPALALGGLQLEALAIDGDLHGPLRAPKGRLTIGSKRLALGDLRLGSPAIEAGINWPLAHLAIDASVRAQLDPNAPDPGRGKRPRGQFKLEGDAQVDDDRDGVLLSGFLVSWPEASLALEKPVRLHLRRHETVLEPLRLFGEHGALTLGATVEHPPAQAGKGPAPARLEANLGLSQFDLSRLPYFALPRGTRLQGICSADLGLTGTAASPDVQGKLDLRGFGAGKLSGIDAALEVQLHRGRLRSKGKVTGLLGAEATLDASLPLEAKAKPTAPIAVDLIYGPLELAQAAQLLGLQSALDAGAAGTVRMKLGAHGTLGQPKATFTAALDGLAWRPLHGGRIDLELAVEKSTAHLKAQLALAGSKAFKLDAKEPLDLALALKEPAVLQHLFEKPGSLRFETEGALPLAVFAQAGLLPEGSSGTLQASAELQGTAAAPKLLLEGKARGVSIRTLRGLDATWRGEAGSAFSFGLQLAAGEVALAKLESSLQVSAPEVIAAARSGLARERLVPLFSRPLSLQLSLDRIVIGESARMAGAAVEAQGTLSGKIDLHGTPDAPQFQGRLLLDGFSLKGHPLGRSDAWVEGDKAGLVAHLGLKPPRTPPPLTPVEAKAKAAQEKLEKAAAKAGKQPAPAPPAENGTLLLHASLQAPLTATALFDGGVQALLDGKLDAHLLARKLDLGFVSGVLPGLRRTAGVLDGEVAIEGILGRPTSLGDAHLKDGFFDVVGQGLFEDVAFDATFSPREIVVDRLTGSTGGGPFSAVLVVGRRKAGEGGEEPPLEFTAELHLGDEEAVRDRKDREGRPLQQRPVPVRQAGEERADVTAEVDLFGEWDSIGQIVTTTVKIPGASMHVRSLPDKKLPSLSPNPEVFAVDAKGARTLAGVDPVKAAADEKARREARLRADVRFELGKLHVWADDFDFDVQSSLHATWDAQHPAEPSADGTIELPRGSFSALGRRFEIEKAQITETGGDIADPELEVQARYINPQATVLVIVTGTAKDPYIDLSSNPAMDQDAITFFLATGRLQGRATQQGGGVDLSNAATSALGGVLFGELRKQMADVMPVDVLTVELGGGGRPAQASVGKYLGDRLFVGYRQRLTPTENENTSEGRIEYEIVRGLGAEATVGEKNRDVSILYTKDF
jgi:autotransporter translocation and assembly factor TamB